MGIFCWSGAGFPSHPSPTETEVQCEVLADSHGTRTTVLINY